MSSTMVDPWVPPPTSDQASRASGPPGRCRLAMLIQSLIPRAAETIEL